MLLICVNFVLKCENELPASCSPGVAVGDAGSGSLSLGDFENLQIISNVQTITPHTLQQLLINDDCQKAPL